MKFANPIVNAGLIVSLFFVHSIFMANGIGAQNMELVNGEKHKSIKAGTYLNVGIIEPGEKPCDQCAGKYLSGRLIKYDHGVLYVQVKRIDDRPEGDTTAHYYTQQIFSKHYALPMMEIKKEIVASLVVMGKHKSKKYSTGETLGHVISVVGFGHLVSAPIVGEDDAGLLVGLGLAELFAGAILSGLSDQPKYVMKPELLKSNDSAKLWEIK